MPDKRIEESGLAFVFTGINDAIKFDDTSFYRNYFNMLPNGKGVDIIVDSSDRIQLIEIKNCKGHEAENQWRTSINNSKIDSAPHDLDVESRDSLDIEVAKKIAMTITCVYGAWTHQQGTDKAQDLEFVWKGLTSTKLLSNRKQILIILFLEGDFQSGTRSKKMIMGTLQRSIEKKLKWLDCKVSVVDTNTYNNHNFSVETI